MRPRRISIPSDRDHFAGGCAELGTAGIASGSPQSHGLAMDRDSLTVERTGRAVAQHVDATIAYIIAVRGERASDAPAPTGRRSRNVFVAFWRDLRRDKS